MLHLLLQPCSRLHNKRSIHPLLVCLIRGQQCFLLILQWLLPGLQTWLQPQQLKEVAVSSCHVRCPLLQLQLCSSCPAVLLQPPYSSYPAEVLRLLRGIKPPGAGYRTHHSRPVLLGPWHCHHHSSH